MDGIAMNKFLAVTDQMLLDKRRVKITALVADRGRDETHSISTVIGHSFLRVMNQFENNYLLKWDFVITSSGLVWHAQTSQCQAELAPEGAREARRDTLRRPMGGPTSCSTSPALPNKINKNGITNNAQITVVAVLGAGLWCRGSCQERRGTAPERQDLEITEPGPGCRCSCQNRHGTKRVLKSWKCRGSCQNRHGTKRGLEPWKCRGSCQKRHGTKRVLKSWKCRGSCQNRHGTKRGLQPWKCRGSCQKRHGTKRVVSLETKTRLPAKQISITTNQFKPKNVSWYVLIALKLIFVN